MPFNPSLLNSTVVKKFIDRLEKSYKNRGVTIKRTSVQEDVANMFGFASYYEMNQEILNKNTKQELQPDEIKRLDNTIETFRWYSKQIVLNPTPYIASELSLPTVGVTLPILCQHRPQNVKDLSDFIKIFAEQHLEVLNNRNVGEHERYKIVQHYCTPKGVFGFESKNVSAAQQFAYILDLSISYILYEQERVLKEFNNEEKDISPSVMGL